MALMVIFIPHVQNYCQQEPSVNPLRFIKARPILHRMWNLFCVLAIVYVLVALFVIWNEPRMIYYPSRPLDASPDQAGMSFEDVWITTSDNVRLHAWWLPSPASTRRVALFFHGNAGNISHRLDKVQILHDAGLNVFIIDYRGYGQSEGSPNEPGTYRDAQAAYDHLIRQRHIDPGCVILYGESLGSAVAVELATRAPVAGLVIEEGFTSVPDVGQQMLPFLPVRWLARNRYDSIRKIGSIRAPLLVLHSRDDEVFDITHGERLYAAANDPKRFVTLHGGHNDAFLVSGDGYRGALIDFLRTLPASPCR
jgi:hypothetical protein